ncbi:MAG: hypothetical protein Q9178_004550 [Gyalolechia marmorata]
MAVPRPHLRVREREMISVYNEEKDSLLNLHVKLLSEVEALRHQVAHYGKTAYEALRNQYDSLKFNNKSLQKAHDRLSKENAELDKLLKYSVRDRVALDKENRKFRDRMDVKDQMYRDLVKDHDNLYEQNRNLQRFFQRPNRPIQRS